MGGPLSIAAVQLIYIHMQQTQRFADRPHRRFHFNPLADVRRLQVLNDEGLRDTHHRPWLTSDSTRVQ